MCPPAAPPVDSGRLCAGLHFIAAFGVVAGRAGVEGHRYALHGGRHIQLGGLGMTDLVGAFKQRLGQLIDQLLIRVFGNNQKRGDGGHGHVLILSGIGAAGDGGRGVEGVIGGEGIPLRVGKGKNCLLYTSRCV